MTRAILVDRMTVLGALAATAALIAPPDLRIVGEVGDGMAAEALVERPRPEVVLMDLRMPRRDGVEATRRIVGRWPEVRVLVLTTFDDDELVFRSIEAGATGYPLKDVGSDALAEAVRAAGRGESPIQPSIATKLLGRLRTTSAGGRVGGETGGANPGRAPQAGADPGRGRLDSAAHPLSEEGGRRTDDPLPGPEPLTQRDLDVLRLLGSGASNREIAERLGLSEGTVKNFVSALLGKTGLRPDQPGGPGDPSRTRLIARTAEHRGGSRARASGRRLRTCGPGRRGGAGRPRETLTQARRRRSGG